jgi:hypothetical protein
MIKKFIKVFLIVDFGVIVFCLLQGNMLWILNTQIAFISSLLITIGSYLGYKRNIEKRVSNGQVDIDQPDSIDKIDDEFDLYSEYNINENELSKEEVQEIFEDEKEKLKNQNKFKNTLKSLGAASSVYRLAGYGGLVIGFFYLNNNSLLDPISYLIGFIIVPVATLATRFTIIKES